MIPRADPAALVAHATGFLRWWRRELTGMLPSALRGTGPATLLDLRGSEPSVARRARKGQWQAFASFPPVGDLERRVRRLLAAEHGLVLAVPSAWILRRVLRLPAAAEARLDGVLDFELEQHMPFATEDVVRAVRVLRRMPDAQQVEVEVAILPHRLVAAAVAGLRGMGVTAPLVARTDPGAHWPCIPLDSLSPPRRLLGGRVEAGLAAAVLLLAIHVGQDHLRKREQVLEAIQARAAPVLAAAERVLALEAEVSASRGRLSAALNLRRGRPPGVEIVEELARHLPDDAWLTEFRLSGDQLSISGFATRSDALIRMLGASPIFQEVRFTAPVTRSLRDTADRFQVGLRVVPVGTRLSSAQVVER